VPDGQAAVVWHRQAPAQVATRHGDDGRDAVGVLGLHVGQIQRRFHPRGPMRQERPLFQPRAHRALIQPEPAWPLGGGRIGINGDDLQIHAVGHAQHAVVGPHARVRATALGRNTQQVSDIFRTAGKIRRGNDEMINGEFHGGLW
jgi:hypothetical protein